MAQDPISDKARQQANQADFRKVGIPALTIGAALDGFSTHHGLKQSGLRESNPFFGDNPSGAKIGAIKGASTLAQTILLNKLAKDKPKLAKGIALGIGLLQAGIAANNMRLAGKQGKK